MAWTKRSRSEERAFTAADLPPAGAPDAERGGGWRREVEALDLAVYAAISATPTPTLDRCFAAVSRAADHAKLWTAVAAGLAVAGGPAAAGLPPTGWVGSPSRRRWSTSG